ncbi:MAG: hypothetical protein ACI8Q1_002884 [Parvicella sp.]|jgi:hypothetical protein
MWESIFNLTTDFATLASKDELFFGMPIVDSVDFMRLVVRFSINFVFALIIARGIYYPIAKRKDYLFSFLLTNVMIFFIIFTMKKYNIDTGMGLGLFAIFGIIRFRTSTMPVKEMTYLFLIIGMAVVNSMSGRKFSWSELVFINLIIIGATFALEKLWLLKHESRKVITYEKIDNIKSQNHPILKADLEERTGILISRIEIGKINFLNDTAQIIIYYYQEDQASAFQDEGIVTEY